VNQKHKIKGLALGFGKLAAAFFAFPVNALWRFIARDTSGVYLTLTFVDNERPTRGSTAQLSSRD
jgi:hypothetical protein